MKISKQLIKKLENATGDEAVQIFLQDMVDNSSLDKKSILFYMKTSIDKFFKANEGGYPYKMDNSTLQVKE